MQLHLNQVFLQEIQEIALVDFNNFLTMEISDLLDCDNAATMETYALHFGALAKMLSSLIMAAPTSAPSLTTASLSTGEATGDGFP